MEFADAAAGIQATLAAYAQALDDGRTDDVVATFCPDGTCEIPGLGTHHGHDALRQAFAKWVPRQPQRHVVVNTHVTEWSPEEALRELMRGRLQGLGPVSVAALAKSLGLGCGAVDAALLALQSEGFAMRGRFTPGASEDEWCERGLLARIHRYTVKRLRAEVSPVSGRDFVRFLAEWQRLAPEARMQGPDAVAHVLSLLEGFEAPAAAWEAELLPGRIAEYEPAWLDAECLAGRFVWARLASRASARSGPGPLRSTPITFIARRNVRFWAALAESPNPEHLTARALAVRDYLEAHGASFFDDLMDGARLLPAELEEALGELVAVGLVHADSFAGLRALLLPADRRSGSRGRGRTGSARGRALYGMAESGRWALVRRTAPADRSEAVEHLVRTLLRRWGVLLWRLLAREAGWFAPWREILACCRRLEARGDVRGGRFVEGFAGEQFAAPEAIGLLREVRRTPGVPRQVSISAADPLNLLGILTPGGRLPALTSNRVLYRDGLALAVLSGGEVRFLQSLDTAEQWEVRTAVQRRGPAPLPPDISNG